MRRSRIVIVAILLAIVGTIMPIARVLYMSWRVTAGAEEDHLAMFAGQPIARAGKGVEEAREAPHGLAASELTPFSAEHIARMRRLVPFPSGKSVIPKTGG
jgi:sensor c-di-GMP phosphodiesterase-like protein